MFFCSARLSARRLSAFLLFVGFLAVAGSLGTVAAQLLHTRSRLSPGPVSTVSPRPKVSIASAKPKYVVVLVLDGARPDYFHLVPMPHLAALIRKGTSYVNAFVGQEPANTPPSHATIGTGVLPKHHGVQGFLWKDPRTDQVENPTEIGAVINGALEAVLRQHHVPSIGAALKAKDPRARVESVAGHKCYASDAMGTPSAAYILCALIYHNRWVTAAIGSHRPPPGVINNPHWDVPIPPRTAGFGPAVQQWRVGTENAWTVRYGLWAFKAAHYPQVVMMNLAETDVLGHFAPNDAVIRTLMKEFDGLLGQIEGAYHRAGVLSQTDFIITADHGMSRIRNTLPYTVLSNSVAEAGTTAVYVEHDTAGLIGLQDPSRARTVALNILYNGGRLVDATYYKARVEHRWVYRLAGARPNITPRERHAYQFLANTMAADSGADVAAVFAPHVSTRNFEAFGYAWRAGHLGPQWDDQHIPLILSGPGVKHRTSTYPARLVDIAPTIEHLLGAPVPKVDGVVLEDALQHVTVAGLRLQRTRAAQLTPVVDAIKARSGQS